jgi:hypothetical protein
MGLQQDSVSAQRAKTTQDWLRMNLLAFISAENWLLGNADLKPLDNKLWAVLEDMAHRKRHNSLESLRRSLVKAVAEIPLETERAATTECLERLTACVEA